MRSEFAFAQSLHLQTSKIDNMVFFKIRTGLMAHLRLMTINTASTFWYWFIRGGMIHKLIWYSLISIGNVCYVNTYNISFFKKYSSNDHAEKLQCLLTIRIRYYVIEWQAKVLGFFFQFFFFRKMIIVTGIYDFFKTSSLRNFHYIT